MAFNNKLDTTFPGIGVSTRSSANVALAIALSTTGAVSNTIPSTGTLIPAYGLVAGCVRVRIYGGAGTSPTVVAVAIKLSDGTNTVTVGEFAPTVAATLTTTTWIDWICDFIVDFGATSGGATGMMITNSTQTGATTLIVVTTLGGTTPTASMDVEVYGLVG